MHINKRLKILIIPYIIPYPTNDGGKICTFGFIDSLREKHDLQVLFQVYSEEDLLNITELKQIWKNVEIQTVDLFENRNKLTFTQSILKHFLFKAQNFIHKILIKFKLLNLNTNQTSNELILTSRATPCSPPNKHLISKLTELLSSSKFDIVQIEYTNSLNLIHIIPKEIKKIFVQIESRFEVLKDFAVSKNLSNSFIDFTILNTKFLEHQYMSKYDAILTLNESDKLLIESEISGVKVYNSPYGILNKDLTRDFNISSSYEKLIFLGGDNHYPNLDAIEWYSNEIEKCLKIEFPISLEVIGKWSITNVKKYSSLSIIFKGFIKDLKQGMHNGILIVPIRIGGGGIRSKILEAMSLGIPVITTSLAAVGISSQENNVILIANSALEFNQKINFILENPKLTLEMCQRAQKLIHEKYSQQYTSQLREKYYYEIIDNN